MANGETNNVDEYVLLVAIEDDEHSFVGWLRDLTNRRDIQGSTRHYQPAHIDLS
jgi:hypothetical protein